MATVLTYRGDDDQPHCEIKLNSGERVQIRVNRDGVLIEQAADNGGAEILFRGTPDIVADIYGAMLSPGAAVKTAPLDMVMFLVTQLPSATDVRDAFKAATTRLS